MVQIFNPGMHTIQAAPFQQLPQPYQQGYGNQQPGNGQPKSGLDYILDKLGTAGAAGLESGIAGGIQQQLKRSALDKMLNNLNPNMSPRDRLGLVASADAETQPLLQEHFKQEDARRLAEQKQIAQQQQAEAFNRALQGIYGQPQHSEQNQKQLAQPTAEGQPGQGIGSPAGITDQKYQDMILKAAQHKADQEQKSQQHQQNQDFQRRQKQIESEEKISLPILQEMETKRASLPTLQSALKIQKQAIEEGDLTAFSPDNLADMTGWEGFRTGSGALFKTAGKEFFLGSINQVGRQPNQWIEQQIFSMAPQIGRNNEANLKVNALLKFKADTDEHDVETKSKLAEDLRGKEGFVPANIGRMAADIEKPYIEKREKQLAYELQKITETENPDKLTQIRKVRNGTPLTREKAQILKNKVGSSEQARKLALALGYEIPDADIISQGNR